MGIYADQMEQIFLDGYLECALWSSIDNATGEPLDENHGMDDIDPQTLEDLKREALQFFNDNIELINDTPDGYSYGHAGHDLWLTRNGHGAGFWDGDAGRSGDALTSKAEALGEIDLYIGDDGLIYK